MKSIITCFLLCLTPYLAFAQNTLTDLQTALSTLAAAEAAHDKQQYSEALPLVVSAYNYFKAHHETALPLSAYQLGRTQLALQQFDTAQAYFLEAAKYFSPSTISCGNAWHLAGRCALSSDRLEEAEQFYIKALGIRRLLQPESPCDLAESYEDLGDLHHALGKYSTAIEDFQHSMEAQIACSGAESMATARVWSNLGMAYLRQGDYRQALHSLETCLAMQQRQVPEVHTSMGEVYHNLGSAYKSMLKPEEAFYYYEKSLSIFQQLKGPDALELASAHDGIGQYYVEQRNSAKALEHFEEMNRIMVHHKQTDSKSYAFVCASIGSKYFAQKDYANAVLWHEKMVDIWRRKNTHLNSQLASMITFLALSKAKNGQFEASFAHYRESIDIWEQLRHPYLAQGYALLGSTYKIAYYARQEDSLLQLGRAWYDKATKETELQLRYEQAPETLRKMLMEYDITVDNAIETEILYLRRFPEAASECAARIWTLQEQMHGYQLMSAMQDAKAKSYAGIPDEERARDAELCANIVALEQQRMKILLEGNSISGPEVLLVNAQIFDQKKALDALRTQFERDYPAYHQHRYQRSIAPLATMQQLLQPRQTLLSYVVGDSSVFALVIQKDKVDVREIRRRFPLTDWVQQMREGIEGYYSAASPSPALYEQSVRQYAKASANLYAHLIAPVADLLTDDLIIIPDGILNEIPFDALLTGVPTDLTNFSSYPFLVKKHQVSYIYSGTTFQQMQYVTAPLAANSVLAMAPFFRGDTLGVAQRIAREGYTTQPLSALPNSGEEVWNIKKNYAPDTQVWLNEKATKATFIEQAGKYKVLHLATHGSANRKAGAFSYLAFAPGNGDDGLLTAGELYLLRLNAALVVLSACETGSGEALKGEGMIGLVRAFMYAGSRSVVASLWRVNDRSTMQVMQFFYDNLHQGKPKQVALAVAKRTYLERFPGQPSHPYFWSAFSVFGDTRPIQGK